MVEMTGIGQQTAGTSEIQKPRRAAGEEELQEKQKRAEEQNSLSRPRYDEYIPEKKEAPSGKEGPEKCIGNTDKVDREIEKLKQKRNELEKQLGGAEEGTEEWKRIRKQLEQVEAELKRKDTDSYRRQHTKIQMQ